MLGTRGGRGMEGGDEPQGGHYSPVFLFFLSRGRIILDVQGHPPLAEGRRGLPLERREIVASPGKWREWSREAVHYCLCAGA